MRLFLSAFLLGSLALAPLAQARGVASGSGDVAFAKGKGISGEALKVARVLAAGEGNLRASSLAAGVLIGSVLAHNEGADELTVTAAQRDAVLKVLRSHNYIEHLAHMYTGVFSLPDLQNVASLYADPRMTSFWKFQSAAVASILSIGVNLEVQLPESPITPLSDGDAMPTRENIKRLVDVWFAGVEAQLDMDTLITGIQARTVARDIEDVLALGEHPAAATLRDAQATSRFSSFDHKELESPRLRNALAHAVMTAL